MKVFILIIFFATGSGQEKVVHSTEFTSLENCKAAGEAMKKDLTGFMRDAKYICTEK